MVNTDLVFKYVMKFRSSMLVLERDETGNVVKTSGLAGLAFEYLAQSLHFTYVHHYLLKFNYLMAFCIHAGLNTFTMTTILFTWRIRTNKNQE